MGECLLLWMWVGVIARMLRPPVPPALPPYLLPSIRRSCLNRHLTIAPLSLSLPPSLCGCVGVHACVQLWHCRHWRSMCCCRCYFHLRHRHQMRGRERERERGGSSSKGSSRRGKRALGKVRPEGRMDQCLAGWQAGRQAGWQAGRQAGETDAQADRQAGRLAEWQISIGYWNESSRISPSLCLSVSLSLSLPLCVSLCVCVRAASVLRRGIHPGIQARSQKQQQQQRKRRQQQQHKKQERQSRFKSQCRTAHSPLPVPHRRHHWIWLYWR